MKHDKPAKRLIELGHEEAKLMRALAREVTSGEGKVLMRKLARAQGDRCKLLSDCIPDAGLDDGVVTAAALPKDRPEDD